MVLRSILLALGLLAATTAQAWTGTADAGSYRIVAEGSPGAAPHTLRLSVSATPAAGSGDASLHAWFLDDDGLILGQAPLAGKGMVLTSDAGGIAVPAGATHIAVLATPAGGTGATALISLPAS